MMLMINFLIRKPIKYRYALSSNSRRQFGRPKRNLSSKIETIYLK